ncbi:MAG TPA: large-conductance mechanosensitive channel protein MscL, partial [Bryobacteraceae bacterium]|nr:large-conductance mechanosensitive channel protein MscL [Bryobacteraceae bacterium]
FGKIVTSFVEDILMPPLGKLIGPVDFSSRFISLSSKHYDTIAAAKLEKVATLNYGMFLNNVINFLIVAFAIFLLVRTVNRWTTKPAPPATPTTKDCPQCAMSIPIQAKRCGHCTAQLA